jgi:hypothetical protein
MTCNANPSRAEVLAARAAVIAARQQFRRGEISLDAVYVVVDRYADLVMARAQALGLRTRRPSRHYLLRAL